MAQRRWPRSGPAAAVGEAEADEHLVEQGGGLVLVGLGVAHGALAAGGVAQGDLAATKPATSSGSRPSRSSAPRP